MPDSLTSTNPATGEPVAKVDVDGPAEVDQAFQKARQAQADWAKRPPSDRLEATNAIADELLSQRLDVARAISEEAGKPVSEALVADVMPSLESAAYLDRHGEDVVEGSERRLDNLLLKDRTSRIVREPVGIVGIIAPWNYPLAIPATQTLFALFAGNAVVLKPSELTPGVGERLADLVAQAEIPEGLFQLVQGPGEPTGEALVDAEPDALLFTGSVETGQAIDEACAPTTETVLELGGNDPMLVLDDANVDLAARGATWAAFTNAGQTCSAVERLYADTSLADELTDRLAEQAGALRVGPGDQGGVDVGPLITEEAADRVVQHIEDAVERGAEVVAGGQRREDLGPRFVEPTVLSEVPEEAIVMNEETFGPLLPVARVEAADKAVERANDSRYGLTASVWTTRPERGERLARRLQAGTVTINDHAYTYAACETPWGGAKASGRGHTHGRPGLEAVTRLKHVNRAPGGRRTSPWWFPYDDDLRRLGDEGMEFLYGSKTTGMKATAPLLRRLLGP